MIPGSKHLFSFETEEEATKTNFHNKLPSVTNLSLLISLNT